MTSTNKIEKWLKRLAVVLAISAALALLSFGYLTQYFKGADEKATFALPDGHKLTLLEGREMDMFQNVYVRLQGPKLSHPRQYVTGIMSQEMISNVRIHSDTNLQVFWLTADASSNSIFYIADLKRGKYWPNAESVEPKSEIGQELLSIANRITNIYHLHDGWKSEDHIGILIPQESLKGK